MVLYVEACESGSMFQGLLDDSLPIYAVTAANAFESSWGCAILCAAVLISGCMTLYTRSSCRSMRKHTDSEPRPTQKYDELIATCNDLTSSHPTDNGACCVAGPTAQV